jgi:hypothetical protein
VTEVSVTEAEKVGEGRGPEVAEPVVHRCLMLGIGCRDFPSVPLFCEDSVAIAHYSAPSFASK